MAQDPSSMSSRYVDQVPFPPLLLFGLKGLFSVLSGLVFCFFGGIDNSEWEFQKYGH